jgi:hypothetical protein
MADENALLNDLFAYRILYMDISIDENYIIRKLKHKLIELNYQVEDISTILYSFYNYFDIPITLSEIENVQIQTILNIIFINNDYNYDNMPLLEDTGDDMPPLEDTGDDMPPLEDTGDDMPPLEDTGDYDMPPLENTDDYHDNILNMPYMPNLLNILLGYQSNPFNQVLVEPNNNIFNDVVVITDEQSLNNIPILKISKDMDIKCMICIDEMNENEEYFNIECKHIFHKGCLETYLRNYNHICPICRKEVGDSQAIL